MADEEPPSEPLALRRLALQDFEQAVTSSQQRSHFLRHVNGRLHVTQILLGRFCLATLRGILWACLASDALRTTSKEKGARKRIRCVQTARLPQPRRLRRGAQADCTPTTVAVPAQR